MTIQKIGQNTTRNDAGEGRDTNLSRYGRGSQEGREWMGYKNVDSKAKNILEMRNVGTE